MLHFNPITPCDNLQTIKILTINWLIIKLRHVDTHKHWLRQEASGEIPITWVRATVILADGLTKSLPTQRHLEFIELLGLVDPAFGTGLDVGNGLINDPHQGDVSARVA